MFGERLRVARARARLSMAALGRIAEVTPQAIKKYEDDECVPNSRSMLKICAALDVSVEWLMDQSPLDFRSTAEAPDGRHAKYWVREAIAELKECGELDYLLPKQ